MVKSPRSMAEAKFNTTQTAAKRALKEKEKARQERMDKTARLRALREAVEAADKPKPGKTPA